MSVLLGVPYAAQLTGADLTGSTVTATITAPDGTTAQPTPAVSGSTATVTIVPAQIGTYLIVWAVTGAVSAGQQDQFTVVAPQIDLISLPDLKDRLHIAATSTGEDDALRMFIRAANDTVENITGPIRPRTRTEVFNGGSVQVLLGERWVSSITSVVESDIYISYTLTDQTTAPVDAFGYSWDPATQILTRRSYGKPTYFRGGLGAVTVTYVAGLATIPDDVQLATAELIRHWHSKTQAFRSTGFGATPADDAFQPGNYLLPNAVMEILSPWRRPPQIA